MTFNALPILRLFRKGKRMKNKIIAVCLAFALLLTSNVVIANSLELTDDVAEELIIDQISETDITFEDDLDQSVTDSNPVEDENANNIEIEVIEVSNEGEITEEVDVVLEDGTEALPDDTRETDDLSDESLLGNSTETESEEVLEDYTTTENNINTKEHNASVSDSFINNCTFIFEHNDKETSNDVLLSNDALILGNVSTMSTETSSSSDIYTTAPEMLNGPSLMVADAETSGLRFKATVTTEQKNVAIEYGILICETAALNDTDSELTLDNESVDYIRCVAYNRNDGIDNEFSYNDDYATFTGSLTGITVENYVSYVTARPYIIYDIDNSLTYVYGDACSESVYRLSKALLGNSSYPEEVLELVQGYVLAAENAVSLSTAIEVYLDECVDRTIGIDPDIDIVKFTPEASSFYTLSFSSEDDASYEILDGSGNDLSCIASKDGPAYLFEKNQTYYIRVRGVANTDYSLQFTPCLENAIIMDFADDTEGFTFGDGASGAIENGILNISINKSVSLTKAYTQNNNLSIDMFDYSRLIIRMKNTTNTTKLSGTVGIDLEYDGTSINPTLDSSMPANMTTFENIEFDFTTRYGVVSSLKFSFGQLLSSLSGNIYIDSIVILPMPEVLAWEFNETTENWSNNEQIDSAVIEEGALVLDLLGSVTGMAPAINSPNTSAYDFDKYNKITIALKNETNSTNMQVYFTTLADGHTSFNENKKFTVEIEPSSSEYIEYSIYLTDNELFTDSLKDIMISIPADGVVSIDYIRLSKYVPVYNDVVWDFEDDDLEGFYSNNERHTLSVNYGAMIVETQNMDGGAFYTPSELNLPTSEYRYLVVGINSSSAPSDFQVYFTTTTMNPIPGLNYNYRETDHSNKVVYKHTIQIEQSNTFKEYVIDLSDVWDGYTTGYTGNLEQLMLALPKPGTFEIDYIKLSSGNTNQKLSVSVNENIEYKILVSKNNSFTVGTYTVEYDADVFELVDACAFTYPIETDVGQIVGTDISIIFVSENAITFTISNKTTAGAINCLKFKTLIDADTQITVTTSIE